MNSPVFKRLFNFWLGPIDSIRLDTFRVLMGLSMLLYFSAWWRYDPEEWLTTKGFHVSAKAFSSALVLPAMPVEILSFFGIVFFGSILLWTLGFKTRYIIWVLLLNVIYVTFADVFTTYTINKFFLVTLAVFAFVPHNTYWSLDRRVPQPQSAWSLRILQSTILLHYFTAGYTKIFWGDWIKDPNTLWTHLQGLYMTDVAAWMLRTFPRGIFSWMQYAALTFEISAPILFISKRLRPFGFLCGFVFQLLIAITMHQLIYFSFQMVCFYVLFFQDKTLHNLHNKLCIFLIHKKSSEIQKIQVPGTILVDREDDC